MNISLAWRGSYRVTASSESDCFMTHQSSLTCCDWLHSNHVQPAMLIVAKPELGQPSRISRSLYCRVGQAQNSKYKLFT